MKLETARLLLREYILSDADNYFKLKSCPEVWKYSTNSVITDKEASTRDLAVISSYSKSGSGFCALILKETGEYIGEAGVLSINQNVNRCVIGYNLLPAFWGRGLATEISKALVAYAFDNLEMERVEALALKDNRGSCRVLEKSGLLMEGVLRHFTRINGVYADVCYYGMTRGDYEESKK